MSSVFVILEEKKRYAGGSVWQCSAPATQRMARAEDCLPWFALDSITKMVLSFHIGRREGANTQAQYVASRKVQVLATRRNMISLDDALLLINKWNQESSKLRCIITRPGVQVCFVGTIDRISLDEAFGLRTLDKESSLILFFNDLTFLEYGDSRMAPDDVHLKESAVQYEGFLIMLTSDGNTITLGEIKE